MSNVVINPFALAASSSFVPTDIAELERWYDADLSDFTAGTWEDLSDNGVDVSQATAGNRPTANATGINGQPSLTFDGSNDYLFNSTPLLRATDAVTALCVMDAASQGGFTRVLCEGRSSNNNPIYGVLQTDSGGDDQTVLIRQDNFSTVFPDSTTGFTVYDSNVSFQGVKIDQTAEEVTFIDELTEGTPQAFSASIGTITIDRFAIGCLLRTSASNFFNGELGAILIFSKLLSSTELEDVRDYYVDRGYLSAL